MTELKKYDSNIYLIDFSECEPEEMIVLLKRLRDWIAVERRLINVVAVFGHRNYLTYQFINTLMTSKIETIGFIIKVAIVGFVKIQKLIFEKFKTHCKLSFELFDSIDDALCFLKS